MSAKDFKKVWAAMFLIIAALGAIIFLMAIILETFFM